MTTLARAWATGALAMLAVMGSSSGLGTQEPRAAPPAASWPSAFEATFESDCMNTTGEFAILVKGAVGVGERIVLADGSRDHLCSTFHKGTACTQLTTKGFRYLVFPDIGDCCKCCTYTAGTYECGGPVGPKWVSNATGNVRYEGVETIRGHDCHKWSIIGLMPEHPNYYWQSVETGVPCGLQGYNYLRTPAERADNQYLFDVDTLRLEASPSLFEVPEVCAGARYCGKPVCATGPELEMA